MPSYAHLEDICIYFAAQFHAFLCFGSSHHDRLGALVTVTSDLVGQKEEGEAKS